MKNCYDAIKQIVGACADWNDHNDTIERLVSYAYYIGREEATRELCDEFSKIIEGQKFRAQQQRYCKMAMSVIGNKTRVYSDDYAGEVIKIAKEDKTEF